MTDFLDKYNPQTSVLTQFDVDVNLPESEYAFEVYKQLIVAKRGYQLYFLAIGKLLKEMRDKKLYVNLDYEHFEDFIGSEEISFSRESVYMFIRIYEFYIEKLGLSESMVSGMTLTKLSLMIPMVKDLEKEEAITKIQELSSLRHTDFMIRSKQDRGTDKPTVWYSKEIDQWLVQYFSDRTKLVDQGSYKEFLEK